MATEDIRFRVGLEADQSIKAFRSQLNDLRKVANEIFAGTNKNGLQIQKQELQEIRKTILEVDNAFTRAFNADLGTYNIQKLSSSLRNIGVDKIAANFSKLGAEGQNAFRNITTQVLSTNLRLKETNKIVDKMAVTMANTIRFGISSSIMNSFTGSVQRAYGFVKSLDTSLNNIRVVSGQSAAQMEEFAKQANVAAQSLGSTTTAYTDAALIYYQQGLGEDEVKERTETTIKMSNVLRESSEEVSSYMTAIWNNFDDGSKSLEYYGDVITALGAKTASSAAEISRGLSQFASTADTIGLSYEYATSSLAAVVAATRQSADTVGTAFKTIFSRIQGLSLGETLDDGTNLNKYSKALNAIGVSIKDQSGELKNMDAILEEMAQKWTTLDKDQQMALAQTVAGTRQYTYLISLMENWGNVTKNIQIASEATGTLNKQQEIYNQSLAAHTKQLEAAKEGLSKEFFDSDSFKSLLDGLSSVTKLATNFVAAMDGGGNVLLALGSTAARVFSTQISTGIAKSVINIENFKYNTAQLESQLNLIKDIKVDSNIDEGTKAVARMREEVLSLETTMSQEQQEELNRHMEIRAELENENALYKEKQQAALDYLNSLNNSNAYNQVDGNMDNFRDYLDSRESVLRDLRGYSFDEDPSQASSDSVIGSLDGITAAVDKAQRAYEQYQQTMRNAGDDAAIAARADIQFTNALNGLAKELTNISDTGKLAQQDVNKLNQIISEFSQASTAAEKAAAFEHLKEQLQGLTEEASIAVEETVNAIFEVSEGVGDHINSALKKAQEDFDNFVADVRKVKTIDIGINIAGGLGQAASALESLGSIAKTLNDDTLSAGQKILRLITTAGMTLGLLYSGLSKAETGILTLIKKQVTKRVEASHLAALETATEAEKAGILATQTAEIEAQVLASKTLLTTLGAVVFAVGAIGWAYKQIHDTIVGADKEAAELAKQSAEAATQKTQEVKQERDSIKEVSDAYKDLEKEYGNGAEEELRKKTIELLEAHGLEKEAIEAKTKSYAELRDMMHSIANDDSLINQIADEVKAYENSMSSDIWANQLSGSEKDKRKGTRTIDLGSQKDVDTLKGIKGIKDLGSGHIDLSAFVNEMANNQKELRTSLEAINSDAANRLLEIMASQSDSLNAIADAKQLEKDIKVEELVENTEIRDKEIKSIAEYEQAKSNIITAIRDEFETELEVEQYAENYLIHMSDAAAEIEGILNRVKNAMPEGVGAPVVSDETKAKWDADFDSGSDALEEMVEDKLLSGAAKDETEALQQIEEAIQKYRELGQEMPENLEKISKAFDIYKNLSGNYNATLEDASKYMEKDSEGKRKAFEKWSDKNDKTLEQEKAVEDALVKLENTKGITKTDLSALTQDDWNDIFGGEHITEEEWNNFFDENGQLVDSVVENIKEKIRNNFANAKELFSQQSAERVFNDLQQLYDNRKYISDPEQFTYTEGKGKDQETINAYNDILEKQEEIVEFFPELEDEMAILEDKSKIGSKEWEDAAKKVMDTMSFIKSESDGAYSADDAKEDGMTIKSLQKARQNDEDTYQQKLQGTIDAEMEAIKVSEEKFDSYVEGLKAINKNLEIEDSTLKTIAAKNKLLEDSINKLVDVYDDYYKVLKKGDTATVEYQQAMAEMRAVAEEIFGTDLSQDFIQDHLAEIEKLVNGDLTVFDELQKAAAEDILVRIAGVIDETQLTGEIAELNNMIQAMDLENLEFGTSLDTTGFDTALQAMLDSGALTVDQINAILESIGFEPKIEYVELPVDEESINEQTQTAEVLMPDGKKRTVSLSSVTKTAGGSIAKVPIINGSKTSYRGAPKSTTAPKKSSNAPKSGGGKGGSSGKSKEPKDPDKMEKLEDQADRYHDINLEIKNLDVEYERLAKAQSKLTGKELIDNLNKQLKILEKQKDAYERKIILAKQEAAEIKAALSAKGVSFGADGLISNYATIMAAKLKEVNDIIDKYNAMSAEEQEKFKDTVEKAKKDYEDFKKKITDYDTLITDTIPGLEDTIQEQINKEIEIQITKFNMEVEIRLELKTAEEQWNRFKRKVLDGFSDDNLVGQVRETFANLQSFFKGNGTGTVDVLTTKVNDIMKEISIMNNGGESTVYGDNKARAMEDLQKYYEELMKELEDIEDMVESIYKAQTEALAAVGDAMRDVVDSYEYISGIINHDMNIIKMVYGEKAYEQLARYYDKQVDLLNQEATYQKNQIAYWEQKMSEFEEGTDNWLEAKENWQDAVDAWYSTIETGIENLQDRLLNSIDNVFEKLNQKVTGGLGLDYVTEEWNLININADRYLDTINSVYEIQKLENKYLDSIDKLDDVKSQQRLNKLMQEELTGLREKDKLTQYDVDRANLKYEIALKELALKNAEQNKSSMRLRRDAAGNYSYQFVADDDGISDTKQELEDLKNQLYNMDKEQYKSNLNDLLTYWVEMQEKMKEAAAINDPEERMKREALIREQYSQLINGIVEQDENIKLNLYESSFEELASMYGVSVESFQSMTDAEKDILEGQLIPQWNSGIAAMMETISGEGGFEQTTRDAFDSIVELTKDYDDALQQLADSAGVSFDAIANGYDKNIDLSKDVVLAITDIVDKREQEYDAISAVVNALDSYIARCRVAKQEAQGAATAAYNLWKYEQDKQAEEARKQEEQRKKKAAEDAAKNASKSGGSGSGGSGAGSAGDYTVVDGDTLWDITNKLRSNPNSTWEDLYEANKEIIEQTAKEHGFSSSDNGWWIFPGTKLRIPAGFDTGGYTGEWGPSGKLAMLHEKELVLNKQDTENLLKTIDIASQINKSLDNMFIDRTAELITKMLSTSQMFGKADKLEQQVYIDAKFEGVTESSEIEEALNNLINVASQRIMR